MGPQILTSSGGDGTKAQVVTDAMVGGWECGEAAPRSSGLWCMEIGYGLCLRGLWRNDSF